MGHKSKLNALKSCTTEVKSKPIYFTEPGIPLVIPDSPRCSAWFGLPEEVPACCNCDNHRYNHDPSAQGTAPLGLMTVTQAIGRRLWNTATTKLTTSEPNPFLSKTCFENSAPSINFLLLTEKDQTFRKLPSQHVPVGSYSHYTTAERAARPAQATDG